MKRATVIAAIVLLFVSVTGAVLLYNKVKKQEKEISHLRSENSNLEDELSEVKSQLEELQESNEELQDLIEERNSISIESYSPSSNYSVSSGYHPSIAGAIQTSIDGEFEGWDGDTIFKMMDGSIWQQDEYSYTYHYAYSPEVLLYNKNGSTYMQVDNMDEAIRVKRIK